MNSPKDKCPKCGSKRTGGEALMFAFECGTQFVGSESYHRSKECLNAELLALRSEVEQLRKLRDATKALIDKLQRVHESPEYMGIWYCAHNHMGPYNGPTYADELRAAKTALAQTKDKP